MRLLWRNFESVVDILDKPDIVFPTMNTSYKPEVLVDGKWSTNALRFATKTEAEASVKELMSRWWVPTDGRATECNDSVTHRFDFATFTNVRIAA